MSGLCWWEFVAAAATAARLSKDNGRDASPTNRLSYAFK